MRPGRLRFRPILCIHGTHYLFLAWKWKVWDVSLDIWLCILHFHLRSCSQRYPLDSDGVRRQKRNTRLTILRGFPMSLWYYELDSTFIPRSGTQNIQALVFLSNVRSRIKHGIAAVLGSEFHFVYAQLEQPFISGFNRRHHPCLLVTAPNFPALAKTPFPSLHQLSHLRNVPCFRCERPSWTSLL